MAKVTLNDLSKALGLNEKEPKKDFHYYGTIVSSNPTDRTYEVSINRDQNVSVEAARLVGAAVGDTVMVTVMANGYATVTGRLGGDLDATDAQRAADDAADVASSAMGTANSALSNAQQANQAATAARTLAEHAEEEAGRAHTAAEQAAEDASSAATSASQAASSASSANTSAQNAAADASRAAASASSAETDAARASAAATNAESDAASAASNASRAATSASNAEADAASASTSAQNAANDASSAASSASSASTSASNAAASASTAQQQASAATTAANEAKAQAQDAETAANEAKSDANDAKRDAASANAAANGAVASLAITQGVVDALGQDMDDMQTHVAMMDAVGNIPAGLHVVPSSGGYFMVIANDGVYVYDNESVLVAKYGHDISFDSNREHKIGNNTNYIRYYDANNDGVADSIEVVANNIRLGSYSVADKIAEAKQAGTDAQGTANVKKRVFVTTPYVPYDVGDLWVGGSQGDIKKCKTSKTSSQSYAAADWELASKYTDDTYAKEVENDLHDNYYVKTDFDVAPDKITATVEAAKQAAINDAASKYYNKTETYTKSEIEQKAGEISLSVAQEEAEKVISVKEISGNIVHVEDASEYPALSLKVHITPKQSGTGTPSPSNVRPISGWESVNVTDAGKNLLKVDSVNAVGRGVTQTLNEDGTITLSGTSTSNYNGQGVNGSTYTKLPAGTYRFVDVGETSGATFYYYLRVQGNSAWIRSGETFTVSEGSGCWIVLYFLANTTVSGTHGLMIVSENSTYDTFEPYNGHTTTTSLGRTVYGGTLDVVSGVLTVDKGFVTVGNLTKAGSFQKGTYTCCQRYDLSPVANTVGISQKHGAISNMGVEDNAYYGSPRPNESGSSDVDFAIGTVGSILTIYDTDLSLTDATFADKYGSMQIVYPLATPQTYTLTPAEVSTLLGENNVWADAGAVDLKYATMNSDMNALMSKSNADLKITAEGISSEVSKKVGNNEVISKINQSAESVKIQANKVEIDGTATFNAIKSKADAAYDAKGAAAETNSKAVSRGEQLVTNGNGLLGNNTNFSNWTFDGSQANYSPGSFTRTGGYANICSDDFFPVDTSKRYRFEFDMKSANNTGTMYSYINFYDVDKKQIEAYTHMYFSGTTTTLAQDLKAGDTTVKLTDATNYSTRGTATHLRALIFWDYKNNFGYTYLPETYSRNYIGGAWANDSSIDKTTNTITLANTYNGPTRPAGTYVSQGTSGGNYKYGPLANNKIPTDWTHYVGYFDGVDYSGTNKYNMFPPGTAYAKVGFLWNYNSASDQFWVTNIQVYEDYKTDITKALTKKSTHTISSTNASGTTMAQLLTWSKEGFSTTWYVSSSADVSVGDTVRVAYKVSDMTGTPTVYVVGTVTAIPSSTSVTMISHGLDTTIIDGGNILTNSITANQIKGNTITLGQIDTNVQNSILNENIEVGGRNLVTGSYNLNGFSQESSTKVSVVYTDEDVTITNISSGTWGIFKDILAESSTNYTISFTCSDITGPVRYSIGGWKADGSLIGSAAWNGMINYTAIANGKIIFSFETPEDCAKLRIYLSVVNANSTAKFKRIKLEKGNKATDWTPAPEDVQNEIDDAAKTATDYLTFTEAGGLTVGKTGKNERVNIKSSGMNIYDSSDASVAEFGSTARIGKSNSSRFVTNASSLEAYNSSNQKYFEVSANGITFGTNNTVAKTSDIPTNVSQLTNDSNFATTSQLPTKTSQLTNDSNFQNNTQVSNTATAKADAAAWSVELETTSINLLENKATIKATVYKYGVKQTSGFTRAWYKNGSVISGQTGESIVDVTADALYTCVIT